MKTKISTKKRWVQSSGWRGYYEPIYWVAGANDTGSFSDSPCPTKIATAELAKVRRILRRNGIRYREVPTQSSNVFCIHRYLVVSEADHARACEIVADNYNSELKHITNLLYVNQ